MDQKQRKKHIEETLAAASCSAEAFHVIGHQLLRSEISTSDYLEMSAMLGFRIEANEERSIYQSLNKEFFKANGYAESGPEPGQEDYARPSSAIQKKPARA